MVTMLMMATSALLALLAIPMVRGSLPPNHWYGFRTPRIVADQRLWYPANAMAGKVLWGLSAAMVAITLMRYAGFIPEIGLAIAVTLAPLFAMMFMMVRASMMAADLDAKRQESAPSVAEATTKARSSVPRRETEGPR